MKVTRNRKERRERKAEFSSLFAFKEATKEIGK
jgi:hypothetical protein